MKVKNILKEILSWIITILIAIIVALLVKTYVFELVTVQQTSMYPTLQENDKLISSKISYITSTPQRYDISIISLKEEDIDYVKRVIGMPGDELYIEDSKVYINGNVIEEPYISQEEEFPDYPLVTIPQGQYFVIGDNRNNSLDSRAPQIGFIEEDEFIGKVVFRLTPIESFGGVDSFKE